MRKRAIGSAVAAVAVLGGTVLVATPAQAYAGTPGCVTGTEYNSITKGMTQTQVARRFGTYAAPYWGSVDFSYFGSYIKEVDRDYRRCSSTGKPLSISAHGGVSVDFEN